MKTTKLMAFAIAALTTVLLSSAAQAQTGAFVSFKGVEISAGHRKQVKPMVGCVTHEPREIYPET